MRRKKYLFGMFLLFVILMSVSFASAYVRTITSGAQYANIVGLGGFGSTNSLKFDKSMCEQGGKDLLVQIVPFGCTPAVIRSDLLEDQDSQVFCQLGATQINPLIDIETIDYITITGNYSEEVRRVDYFPSQAALGIGNGELTSPILSNLGYVVITVKQQPNESAMPNYIQGNLNARIRYDIKGAFGVGDVNFYLPVLNDEEWNDRFTQYSFWQGRGYLRALSVNDEGAQIAVYADDSIVTSGAFSREGRTYSKVQYSSFYLRKGGKEEELYLPGFNPCLATFSVSLDALVNPETRVKLKVGSDYVEAANGEKFLENKCQIKGIIKEGLYQSAKIYCQDDEKSITKILKISPRVKLGIDGETKEYGVGDWLFETENGDKSVYLGYVGSYGESEKSEDMYVYLIALPEHKDKLSTSDLASVDSYANSFKIVKTGASVYDSIAGGLKRLASGTVQIEKGLIKGEDFFFISYKNPNTGVISASEKVKEKQVSVEGFGEGEDRGILTLTEDEYVLKESSSGVYFVLSSNEEKIGLRVRESQSGGTPKLILEADSSVFRKYGEFFPENVCTDYGSCSKFTLSTGSEFNPPKNLEGFFENLVGAEIIPSENKLTKLVVFRAVFDDSSGTEFNKYYESAMKDFQTIDVSFADEQDSENSGETYGERALYDAISLARDLNRKKTMLELCEEFKDKYDQSILYADVLEICDNEYRASSDETSNMEVSINGILKKISFEGIFEPSFDEYGVELLVQGPNGKSRVLNLNKDKIIYLNEFRESTLSKGEYVKLGFLDENFANIYIYVAGDNAWEKGFSPDTRKLELDTPIKVGSDYTFTLKKINLEKSAKVSINGNFNFQYTEANFGFKVGIEKRSFPLTPEKASRKIESLNSSIKDLQKASDALAGVVKTMKNACLLTGGWLTVKNLAANLNGKSIARQKIMQGVDGWTEKCTDLVSERKYSSLDQCFLKNSDLIDREVEGMYQVIQTQNDLIKKLEDAAEDKNGNINQDKFVTGLSSETIKDLKTSTVQTAVNSVNPKEPIDFSKIDAVLGSGSWSNGKYSLEQLKEIALYAGILQSTTTSVELKTTAKERLYNVLGEVEVNAQTYAQRETLANSIGIDPSKIVYIQTNKETQKYIYEGLTNANTRIPGIPANTPVAIVQTDIGNYIFVLDNSVGTNIYPIQRKYITQKEENTEKTTTIEQYQIYTLDGRILVENPNPALKNCVFEKYDEYSYKNTYKNPVLRYYEEEPSKGDPAIVPLNTKEGWYAATKPFIGSETLQAYDVSGVVKVFWVCNVGKDGLEDFFSSAKDDVCEMFNLRTGQSTNQFPGLSATKSATLVNLAQNSINAAQRAYVNGIKKVRINGQTFNVGSPAVLTPTIQCQDFMSPKDCNLLFNVCDPVVCPSSRCDLGGTYPVQNVIQSGIIGSLALCLPNIKEGIMIPICISGVQAGLDGFISVQKSYVDCLQQNLDTGQTVGICDEVYSIYMCDFFWKQAIPLIKLTVPKVLSAIFGQNARGGGEYLGVRDALDKAKESVDYFKESYAANSWKAFKLRSTEEVGIEVCQSFPSIVTFKVGEILDSLTEPDSPFQFTGNFEENLITTATNPPLSHYKVFYHIYAGKDTGAYYFVYLRQGTGSSYYQDTVLDRRVESGYIPIGEYATNTIDFTAPSGYKQLCISVNGQEDCNFERVSTSFAINYLSEMYIKEQSTTLVKTTTECVSGTASLYSLLNPNILSAVEEMRNPKIYENGIIRTCATDNPGLGTDPSRWVSVGYCGDTNVKCWLDRDKVKEIVKSLDIESDILEQTTQNYQTTLFNQGDYITTEQFKANMSQIESAEIPFLKKIELINDLFEKVYFNNQKARLFLIRGETYAKLAKEAYDKIIAAETALKERLEAEANVNGGIILEGGTISQTEFNSKYISPIIKFDDGKLLVSDLCYRFFNSKWYWTSSCGNNDDDFLLSYINYGETVKEFSDFWVEVNTLVDNKGKSPREENLAFINNLQEATSYLEGLKLLIERTIADEEKSNPVLSNMGITEMDEGGIFTVKLESASIFPQTTEIYYKYVNSASWKWSPDKENWMTTDTFVVSGGKWNGREPAQGNKNLINALKEKDFYGGAAILFDVYSSEVQKISGSGITIPSTGYSCDENIGEEILSEAIDRVGDDTTREENGQEVYSYVCTTFVSSVLFSAQVLSAPASCSNELVPYVTLMINLVELFKETNGYFVELDEKDWKEGLMPGDVIIWGGALPYKPEYQHITIFNNYVGNGVNITHDGGKDVNIGYKTYYDPFGSSWYITHIWRAGCF